MIFSIESGRKSKDNSIKKSDPLKLVYDWLPKFLNLEKYFNKNRGKHVSLPTKRVIKIFIISNDRNTYYWNIPNLLLPLDMVAEPNKVNFYELKVRNIGVYYTRDTRVFTLPETSKLVFMPIKLEAVNSGDLILRISRWVRKKMMFSRSNLVNYWKSSKSTAIASLVIGSAAAGIGIWASSKFETYEIFEFIRKIFKNLADAPLIGPRAPIRHKNDKK
jgi:hypothetical protein